ncbi:enkurin-like [Penaeus japonicus]|uniref:enkurin-like n=1 Tax=Penaeus japonicus TaxID=27405 RepID=UPI001C70BD43|nr:enkurin-like [Penaeus japonicus]
MELNETITNLLPRRQVIFKKEKRHVSLHHDQVRAEQKATRASHATMGHAITPLDPPTKFLRSRTRAEIERFVRENNRAKAADVQHHGCQKRPGLPRPVNYPPSDRHRSGVDWVSSNVERVKEAPVQVPSPRYVDVPTGDTHNLVTSGLYPSYVFKKNFGRVPAYLRRRQAELQLEKALEERGKEDQEEEEEGEEEEEEEERRGGRRGDQMLSRRSKRGKEGIGSSEVDYALLTEEERVELLKGLRENLKEAQRQLQSLPVVCETNATKHKRDFLEHNVSDLGRYIFLLENHKVAIRD